MRSCLTQYASSRFPENTEMIVRQVNGLIADDWTHLLSEVYWYGLVVIEATLLRSQYSYYYLRLSSHSDGSVWGGLVARFRPRDRRVAGPKPDSTEDPPCMGPVAR
ncbi:hypothetical protein AVEN_146014-1 [Araneus ventricosus]|uniref:Uncharacterized protein n=1 Tax=Araneus ventricosus TaxID=182803 RepID=A0A4Y2SPZ8_ARAVE|nr:hypothetical protein AVEN_146014-1 [Araneus ventricosus]